MRETRNILPLAVLGVAALFLATDAQAQNSPEAAVHSAIIHISAVLATKDRRPPDPRLKTLRPELRSLPFRGYSLLGVQSCRFQTGDQCAMDIPGGGYLQIRTTESTEKHLKMRLLLIQNNRPILNADVKLHRNAGILLKSSRTESGTVIVSIKAPGAGTAIEDLEQVTRVK